jgi:hypothetical protein
MDSSVTFDPTTRVIGFSVKVAGRSIPCFATEEWLRETYGQNAVGEGAVEAYDKRRAAIDATALRAWLASHGAEPVWLKRDQIWRQAASVQGEKRLAEKHSG